MKKTLLVLAVLMFLGTLAFGQCVPPVVNGSPVTIGPGSAPDYFNCANYASSPLPKRSCSAPAPTGTACYGDLECSGFVDPANPTLISICNGPITGGGIHKFVDTLPDLQPAGTNLGINNLGNYIPLAVPDTVKYPGSDYYEIGLKEYTQQFHQDLPLTKLRGYCQLNDPAAPGVCTPRYLGPTILATKDRPVRILFRNLLPAGSGGDLFVPVDTTVMGAGMGPDMGGMSPPMGIRSTMSSQPHVHVEPQACWLLHGEPRYPAPARRPYSLDQRRNSSPVDHPR